MVIPEKNILIITRNALMEDILHVLGTWRKPYWKYLHNVWPLRPQITLRFSDPDIIMHKAYSSNPAVHANMG